MLFSVGAVLLLVVGLSLTLIFKGHHIDGEISSNRHMRERGITCAAADGRNADGGLSALQGASSGGDECQDSSCANCAERCISTMKS